jgi:phage shock protein PspC (stress-responsive transcriptional regulator)
MSCKMQGLNKIIAVLRGLLIATAFALATYFLLTWVAPDAEQLQSPWLF